MQSDITHTVNLEVTVPRIVFATGTNNEARYTGDDAEQVRLMPMGDQPSPAPSETSTHQIHAIRFRLFRIQLPPLRRPLLFQVLRRWHSEPGQDSENRAPERAEQLSITESTAFSVEFRSQSDPPSPATAQAIRPGLNRVIIYLNHEYVPDSYTIDGA